MDENEVYQRLGVAPIINAAGDLTRLGGRLISKNVAVAMEEASRSAVRIDELQTAVGHRIAEVTRSEGGYVVPGAAAGLVLGVAACLVEQHEELAVELPRVPLSIPSRVVLYRAHMTHYARMFEVSGASLCIVEGPADLTRKLETGEVAVVGFLHTGADLPASFQDTVKITQQFGVPIVVDASVALPPIYNLWRYSELGADLVAFSGGKAIGGPQASGFVCGREDLIRRIADLHLGSVPYGVGRAMKVGKEEIVGLAVALEEYLVRDHAAEAIAWAESAKAIANGLCNISGITVKVADHLPNGRPLSCVVIDVDVTCSLSAAEISRSLQLQHPAVMLNAAQADEGRLIVYVANLRPGEEDLVVGSIKNAFHGHAHMAPSVVGVRDS